jgi:hypothetical protein
MSIKINADELDTLTREELIDLIKLEKIDAYLQSNIFEIPAEEMVNTIKKHSKEIAESVEKNNELLAKLKRLNKGEMKHGKDL